jgi:ABC-type Na+ efflux pump permease subunit
MIRILDITLKDLMQLMRDFKTFMFLLIMPIIFTLLFGYASGAFSSEESDSRLPVGYLNEDNRWVDQSLHDMLADSETIRLVEYSSASISEFESLVADGNLAAAIIVPRDMARYQEQDHSLDRHRRHRPPRHGRPFKPKP